MHKLLNIIEPTDVNPEVDSYYAVGYTLPRRRFYIGRVVNADCSCENVQEPHHVQFTFLERRLCDQFTWPKRPDTECVPKPFVFWGPLALDGNLPFTVPDLKGVQAAFKRLF